MSPRSLIPLVPLVVLAGALHLVASCTAEERMFTGGAGGGSSSTGTGAPCSTDADCNDGLACNGVETCAMDTCKAGEPACETPDPLHCVPACTEGGGAPMCDVAAADADGDNHGDMGCSAVPTGDDCDDTNATVAPGLPEICDGLDNDCDKLADLEDGLSLSGASKELWSSDQLRHSIAYSPALGTYGIATVFLEVPEIYFGAVDQSGALVAPRTGIGAFEYAEEILPRLAPMGSDFGVVWHDEGMIKDGIFLQRVSASGAAIGAPVEVSIPQLGARAPDIVAEEAGSVVVVWQNYGAVFARRVGADGALAGTEAQLSPTMTGAVVPRIARLEERFGVVWKAGSGASQSVEFAIVDAGLSLVGPVESLFKGPAVGEPTIAVDGDGFTIVWREPGSTTVHIARRDKTGTALCQGIMNAGKPFGLTELVAGPSGAFMLESAVDVSNEDITQFVRLRPDCTTMGEPVRVSEAALTEEDAGRAVGAAGKSGFVVAWANVFGTIETNEKLMVRTFGPNFCD